MWRVHIFLLKKKSLNWEELETNWDRSLGGMLLPRIQMKDICADAGVQIYPRKHNKQAENRQKEEANTSIKSASVWAPVCRGLWLACLGLLPQRRAAEAPWCHGFSPHRKAAPGLCLLSVGRIDAPRTLPQCTPSWHSCRTNKSINVDKCKQSMSLNKSGGNSHVTLW